jgi:signal transduction histidine kinase
MQRLSLQPLRRQLVVAAILVVLPLLAAVMWAARVTLNERLDDLRGEAKVTSSTAAVYLDRYLAGLDALAVSLGTHRAIQELDPKATQALFNRILPLQRDLYDLQLLAADGTLIASTSPKHDQADWARVALKTGQRSVGSLRFDAGSREPRIIVAYPVSDERGTFAAIGMGIRLAALSNLFATLPLPRGSVVTVTDGNGAILARTMDSDRYVGRLTSENPRPIEDVPATAEVKGVDGVRRMHGNSIAAAGPWVVSVGVPISVAEDRAGSLWQRNLLILFVGLASQGLLVWFMSRRLVRSVAHLEVAAQRVASGDFASIEKTPMPALELTELQDAFDIMVKRLNEARQTLDRQMADERQMREEVQSLQRQIIRQERLAAVGLLVSGVAHEINNPLQAILGFAELLQMQAQVPESVKSDLRLIQKESARACNIIRNLALFARQQPGQPGTVRLTDVISSVAELRQRRLETEDIELLVDDRSTGYVLAVFTELQQVVLNFVVNAEQAILISGRLPGRITIRCWDEDGQVRLEVEDTGPGLDPDNEAKLFQPFFTTKPVGLGTGLGLSVSYGIIDSLGGHIGYRRAPAGGAIFYFDLPVVSPAHA